MICPIKSCVLIMINRKLNAKQELNIRLLMKKIYVLKVALKYMASPESDKYQRSLNECIILSTIKVKNKKMTNEHKMK